MSADREDVMKLVAEAVSAGARQRPACEVVGLDVRTYQRWSVQGPGEDGRKGPNTEPANKLSALERQRIIEVAMSAQFRDMSPKQIVPHQHELRELQVAQSFETPQLTVQFVVKFGFPLLPACERQCAGGIDCRGYERFERAGVHRQVAVRQRPCGYACTAGPIVECENLAPLTFTEHDGVPLVK